MNPRVSIIILNWNGWKDTIECLESLYQITYPNYDVIVVDNGSEDESVQKIKEYCKGKIKVKSSFFEYNPNNKPIHILEYTKEQAEKGGDHRKERYFSKLESDRKLRLILNEKNYGFAEGNNIAVRYVMKALDPDYVLLLNNDTVVEIRFLNELVKFAEKDSKTTILGPKICYYREPEKIQVIGGRINWWKGETKEIGRDRVDRNQYDIPLEVDYIPGTSLLAKKKILNSRYFFDPTYFAYFEETDLCVRNLKNGYKNVYVPTAKVWHKIAKSTGGEFSHQMAYYFVRNRLIFIKKHLKNFPKFFACFSFYHGWVLRKILIYTIKGRIKVVKSIVKGYLEALLY